MSLNKRINLIIYRFRERGLEVFLINDEQEGKWDIPASENPEAEREQRVSLSRDEMIELDPIEQADGNKEEAYAVEGEWHDIPSLKGMLYEDAMQLKDRIQNMEKGAFVTIKDAVKRVLPHQYKFLKELKDVLTDRNSVRDL